MCSSDLEVGELIVEKEKSGKATGVKFSRLFN